MHVYAGDKIKKIELRGCLHIPTMSTNLFSIGVFRKQQGELLKVPVEIVTNGHKMDLEAKLPGGGKQIQTSLTQLTYLHKLNLAIPPSLQYWNFGPAGTMITSSFLNQHTAQKLSLDAWHRKMGHLGPDNIRKAAGMVDGLEFADSGEVSCHACKTGKAKAQHKSSIPLRSTERGAYLHFDLGGPITPTTKRGYKYWLIIVDDITKMTWVFLLRHKSEAFARLKQHFAWIYNQTGIRVKRLRYDNGGKFTSGAMHDFCKNTRVQLEPTDPYTPQQNGTSKRANGLAADDIRAMLVDSGIPDEMWDEILFTVVYLKNRSPTSTIRMTPYEAWTGMKPNVSHLRRIGCAAYKLVPKSTHPKKLDERARLRFLLGYEGTNQYRLWNSSTGGVERAKKVVFDENFTVLSRPDAPRVPSAISASEVAGPSAEEVIPYKALERLCSDTAPEERPFEGEASSYDRQKPLYSDLQSSIYLANRNNMPEHSELPLTYHTNIIEQLHSDLDGIPFQHPIPDEMEHVPETKPKTYRQTKVSSEHLQWDTAMKEEIQSLEKNST